MWSYPRHNVCLSFFPPLSHLGVNLLSHLWLDLTRVSCKYHTNIIIKEVEIWERWNILCELPFFFWGGGEYQRKCVSWKEWLFKCSIFNMEVTAKRCGPPCLATCSSSPIYTFLCRMHATFVKTWPISYSFDDYEASQYIPILTSYMINLFQSLPHSLFCSAITWSELDFIFISPSHLAYTRPITGKANTRSE